MRILNLNIKKLLAIEVPNNVIFLLLYCFIFSIAIITIQETIFRNSFSETISWIINRWPLFTFNVCLVFLSMLFLSIAIGNVVISTLLMGFIGFVFSTTNYYLVLYKDDVVTPNNIYLLNEAARISNKYLFKPTTAMLAGGFSFLISLLFALILKPYIKVIKSRILSSTICAVLLFSFFIYLRSGLENIDFDRIMFIPKNSYYQKGLYFGFVREIVPKIKPPTEYSKDGVHKIINDYEHKSNLNKNVNMIMILNESFYNLSNCNDVSFSDSCTPFISDLIDDKRISYGQLVVPVFGGTTCQTEYEVLSGYPVYRTGDRIAYTSLINKDFVSIVSLLNSYNYFTVAIHPYINNFFRRNTVFDFMGFDKTIFEKDMISPEYEGNYISDRYVYNKLIEEYEARDSDKPFFAHIITMQNHGGYDYIYNKHGLTLKNSEVLPVEQNRIQTYINLVRESDDAFKELIQYFEHVSEPTIIVFYGDHAPGHDLPCFMQENNDMFQQHKYTTPLIIWDNIGLKKEDLGYINAFMLSSKVIQMAGITPDTYFKYMNDNTIPTGEFGYYYIDGKWTNEDISDEIQSVQDTLWMLQYDRMFGKKYSLTGKR